VNSVFLRPYRGLRRLVGAVLKRVSMLLIDYAFWVIRRFGMQREMERIAAQRGMDLVIRHYYSPIPDASDFAPGFWDEQSAMPGVEIDDRACLELLHKVFPAYLDEFRNRYPNVKPRLDFPGFYLLNGVYMAVDAHVYYGLIRDLKPARIIEIGAGMSTLLAADAVRENEREGRPAAITAIEPYPAKILNRLPGVRLVRSKLQDVDPALFDELAANDILFIDSTHVLREGNDVQLEYLEILPRLGSGVFVSVHDISLPRRYPRDYFDAGWYWNEQYLLQAFLAFNDRFEIIWPGNYMMLRHAEAMSSVFPEIEQMRQVFPNSEPSAFWMKTRQV
jgi:hypothetical protein